MEFIVYLCSGLDYSAIIRPRRFVDLQCVASRNLRSTSTGRNRCLEASGSRKAGRIAPVDTGKRVDGAWPRGHRMDTARAGRGCEDASWEKRSRPDWSGALDSGDHSPIDMLRGRMECQSRRVADISSSSLAGRPSRDCLINNNYFPRRYSSSCFNEVTN